ncbi:MAG: hypothetical protein MJZ01_07480 [Bacteroidales bacterium]|nr:hypothetical protein [Bacteroidales bacterium]
MDWIGDYFAWGETFPKSNYNWSTYFDTNDGGDTFVKYKNNGGKTELDDADDVAVQTWGGAWRMPTKTQQDELRKECDWEWTSINGVNGYKVKSRVNDNFIFLPAAGSRWDAGLDGVGSRGFYWSRSLGTFNSGGAYRLYFSSSYVDRGYDFNRGFGFSVRPVCPGTK